MALPTASTILAWDHASVASAAGLARQTIDAVLLFVSECREVNHFQTMATSTLTFAHLAEAMCRLLEEGVNVVQDHAVTFAR